MNIRETIQVRVGQQRVRFTLVQRKMRSVEALHTADDRESARLMIEALGISEHDANRLTKDDLYRLLDLQEFRMNTQGQIAYVTMQFPPGGEPTTSVTPAANADLVHSPGFVATKPRELHVQQKRKSRWRRWWKTICDWGHAIRYMLRKRK